MKKILLLVCVLFFDSLAVLAGESNSLDPNLVNQLHKLNKSKPAKVEIIKSSDIEKQVKSFNAKELPGLLQRVNSYKKQIAADHGYDTNPEDTCYNKKDLGDINFYVFISASVPEATLKTYANDIRKISPAVMVLNGAVGGAGKMMPTVNLITKISCGKTISELKKDSECKAVRTDINPYLFRTFNVKAVPAFVITEKPYSEIMLAASKGEKASDDSYLKITGDAPITYVLEHFKAEGSFDAAAMIDMIRSDEYYK